MLIWEHHQGKSLWHCSEPLVIVCRQLWVGGQTWSGLPRIVSSLWTVQSTQYVKFRLIQLFSVAFTQAASLGIFLKRSRQQLQKIWGPLFPFEWVFPESKINQMSGFVHLVGKESTLPLWRRLNYWGMLWFLGSSWRCSTTYCPFWERFTSYIFIRHGPESSFVFKQFPCTSYSNLVCGSLSKCCGWQKTID